MHIREHHERARLVLPLRNGVVRNPAHKPEGALRADEQPLDDLDGVGRGKVDQRIDAVACGALDCELPADEVGQLPVILQHQGPVMPSCRATVAEPGSSIQYLELCL